MKRITVILDDELYLGLLEYTSLRSKKEMRRISLGAATRDLISSQLKSMGYFHTKEESKPLRVSAERAGSREEKLDPDDSIMTQLGHSEK